MSAPAVVDGDRPSERVATWIPYALLVVSTLLVAAQEGSSTHWAPITGLSAVAAAWTYGAFTRARPALPGDQTRIRLYFAGFLAIATVAMAYNPLYFPFVITGLFYASFLRPRTATFVGLGATSLILNSQLASFSDPTAGSLTVYAVVVAIQSAAIGFGLVASAKLTDLSEQRRQTVAELEAALAENAGLHAQLLAQAREAGVNDERQRLAGEIHDTIAQDLAGVITQLEAAHQATGDPQAQRRHLDNAARLARDSLSEARRSVHALRPTPLEVHHLPAALADVANRWSELSEVPVEVTATGTPRWLHPEIEVTLLRVTQEALANVAKHAGASRVGVTLSYLDDLVTLDVRDDGVGFAPAGHREHREPRGRSNGQQQTEGYGLTAMRQRVERLAGQLDIETEAGGGTAISARIPAGVLEIADG